MDDLIQDFIAETREMLTALGGEIVAWEADPDDRSRIDVIFRFVHTVKGNCGFFELPRLQALSHAAEDALSDVRAGRRHADQALVSAVLAVIDRIGEMVMALEQGEEFAGSADQPLIDALSESQGLERSGSAHGLPPASAASTNTQPLRTIRLSVDLLDRMMSGVSDLVLARNELTRRLRETPADAAIHTAFDAVSANIVEMREAITRTRMQRVENLFAALPRMVRDLAAELGKQVVVAVDGGDVELDREMIEMIRDPLTHIIRNAVDHGIEAPDVRRSAGKPETGMLKVSARQTGNQILIEIADDGRGIDGDRLVEHAVASGTLDQKSAAGLSEAQRNALVFQAGVSTAAQVTAISGRGVGMDVVRANIERIGGVVDLESRKNRGTKITLRVPLTLTIIPALIVSVADQTFAIPRSAIEEIVRCKGEAVHIEHVGGSAIAKVRGRRIPMLSLADLIGVTRRDEDSPTLILLKPAGGDVFALAVECVHDHEELVVKPAAPAVMATGLYAGTTLADNGRPILLLDAAGVAATGGISLDAAASHEAAPPVQERAEAAPLALLFRGLDGVKRAVRLALVDRIEEVPASAVQYGAGRLRVVIADRILDLDGCEGQTLGPKLRLVRMSDGASELAYGFSEVIDIVPHDTSISPAHAPGPVAGVTLIGGELVELLDPHFIFAARDLGADFGAAAPLCILPSGDSWMENLLRPLVESAGYRVIIGGDKEQRGNAAIIFRNAENVREAQDDPRTILLRNNGPPTAGVETVHRYDRVGLLKVLASHLATGARRA